MRNMKRIIFLSLIIALLIPSTAFARDLFEDKVVFGGTYTLESGESLTGNLVVIGGSVNLEVDSIVNGDVVLLGGTLDVDGRVNGTLVGLGGVVTMNESAVVSGDLTTLGAVLHREEGSQVGGQIVTGLSGPLRFNFPAIPEIPDVGVPQVDVNVNPFVELMWFVFRIIIWSLLTGLIVLILFDPTKRAADAAVNEPVITGVAGFITLIISIIVLPIITITIILIPVTLVALFVLAIAWVFGWVAVSFEVGRRIGDMLNQDWAPAILAGLGALILHFVLIGFSELIPCLGGVPRVLVGLWGLGAVIMTRFGTQEYPENDEIIDVEARDPVVEPEDELPEPDEKVDEDQSPDNQ